MDRNGSFNRSSVSCTTPPRNCGCNGPERELQQIKDLPIFSQPMYGAKTRGIETVPSAFW